MKKVSLILLLGLIAVVAVSGCISGANAVVNPCERQFQECNHNCGREY